MKLDTNNDTWRHVEAWATARRDKYRSKLEIDGRTAEQYAAARAQVREMTALLNLPTEELPE